MPFMGFKRAAKYILQNLHNKKLDNKKQKMTRGEKWQNL
jgi:hypothetical protein